MCARVWVIFLPARTFVFFKGFFGKWKSKEVKTWLFYLLEITSTMFAHVHLSHVESGTIEIRFLG